MKYNRILKHTGLILESLLFSYCNWKSERNKKLLSSSIYWWFYKFVIVVIINHILSCQISNFKDEIQYKRVCVVKRSRDSRISHRTNIHYVFNHLNSHKLFSTTTTTTKTGEQNKWQNSIHFTRHSFIHSVDNYWIIQ